MIDGSELHVSEYFTIAGDAIKSDKYSYPLQKGGEFVIRWDNAQHHRKLSTFPFHVHRKDNVHESKEMTMDSVLDELCGIVYK